MRSELKINGYHAISYLDKKGQHTSQTSVGIGFTSCAYTFPPVGIKIPQKNKKERAVRRMFNIYLGVCWEIL